MEFKTSALNEGFLFTLKSGLDRTRYIRWIAYGEEVEDSGEIDLSMFDIGKSLMVRTGWKPNDIRVVPIPDPTPGAHQPFLSTLPAGAFELTMTSEMAFEGLTFDFMVSASGAAQDGRVAGSIRKSDSYYKHKIAILSNSAWHRLFLKVQNRLTKRIVFTRLVLTHVLTQYEFEALNHTIKPEHPKLKKEGRDSIVFEEGAREYSYFNIGFQRR